MFSVTRMMPHLCIEAHRLALRTWKTALTIGPCPAIRARRVIHIHLVESNGEISPAVVVSMDDYFKEQVFTWSCVYMYMYINKHIYIYIYMYSKWTEYAASLHGAKPVAPKKTSKECLFIKTFSRCDFIAKIGSQPDERQ